MSIITKLASSIFEQENPLLLNRNTRDNYINRVEVLDKVKKLSMLPDDIHVTVEMAASYYEVPVQAVRSLIFDHKNELESDGLRVIKGVELRQFKTLFLKGTPLNPKINQLTIIPRRAILRIGMLLRDSKVAKLVRSYLLNVEEIAREEAPEIIERALPGTYLEALEELVRTEKERIVLEDKVRVLKPKAESYEHYFSNGQAKQVGESAKILNFNGVGRNTLFAILRNWYHLSSSNRYWNSPYQRYIEAGYYRVKWNHIEIDGVFSYEPTTLITPRGLEYIKKRLIREGYQLEKQLVS